MEYASFYGGRPGNSIKITKAFTGDLSIENNTIKIKDGNSYTPINIDDLSYGDYFVLNPTNRGLSYYGDIYQVGLNGYKKIGNFRGGPGPAPYVTYDDDLTDQTAQLRYIQIGENDTDQEQQIRFYWANDIPENSVDENNLKIKLEIPTSSLTFSSQTGTPDSNVLVTADTTNGNDNDSQNFTKKYILTIPRGKPGDIIQDVQYNSTTGVLSFKIYEYNNTSSSEDESTGEITYTDNYQQKGQPIALQLEVPKAITPVPHQEEEDGPITYIPGEYQVEYTGQNITPTSLFIPTVSDITYDSTNGKLKKTFSVLVDGSPTLIENNDLVGNFKWTEDIRIVNTGENFKFQKHRNTDGQENGQDKYVDITQTSFKLLDSMSIDEDGFLNVVYSDGTEDPTPTQLGKVVAYNGILVGTNLTTAYETYLQTNLTARAVEYLNATYPNGFTSSNIEGKIAVIKDKIPSNGIAVRKTAFFAYDYLNSIWFELPLDVSSASVFKKTKTEFGNQTSFYPISFTPEDFYQLKINVPDELLTSLDQIELTIERDGNNIQKSNSTNYTLADIQLGTLGICKAGDDITIASISGYTVQDSIANGKRTFTIQAATETEPEESLSTSESETEGADDNVEN